MNHAKSTRSIRGTTSDIERRAIELRNGMTLSESMLWQALKAKQLGGLRFRAQHPVGRFILDFYCAECRLAIELDGNVHDGQIERDAERTAILEAYEIQVLRFRNDAVENDLTAVLQRIIEVAAPRRRIKT